MLLRVAKVIDSPDGTKVRDGCKSRANNEDGLQVESRNVRYEPRICRSADRFQIRRGYVYCIRDIWVALTGVSWPSRG